MSTHDLGHTGGQRLGRRLGLAPYYRVTEEGEGRLRLTSLPELNRPVGFFVFGTGLALLLAGMAILVFGALGGAQQSGGFGTLALTALAGGVLGGLGFQRAAGGYAILTTRNEIIVDADAGTVTFTQANRLAGARAQRLPIALISGLRLRRRPLLSGVLIKRVRQIVALELIAGDQTWIVDSAENPEALRAAAEGLSLVLGRGLVGSEPIDSPAD